MIGFRVVAIEPSRRHLLVDVADQAPVDAEPAELAQLRGERGHHFGRNAELLILLLADPAGAIVHGDADASLVSGVR